MRFFWHCVWNRYVNGADVCFRQCFLHAGANGAAICFTALESGMPAASGGQSALAVAAGMVLTAGSVI